MSSFVAPSRSAFWLCRRKPPLGLAPFLITHILRRLLPKPPLVVKRRSERLSSLIETRKRHAKLSRRRPKSSAIEPEEQPRRSWNGRNNADNSSNRPSGRNRNLVLDSAVQPKFRQVQMGVGRALRSETDNPWYEPKHRRAADHVSARLSRWRLGYLDERACGSEQNQSGRYEDQLPRLDTEVEG